MNFDAEFLEYLMRKSSIIPSSKGKSVWSNTSSEARQFSSWQTDCLFVLRSLPGHWDQRFCRKLHQPPYSLLVFEMNSEWDGILLSMTKIPPDDILEGLYKFSMRESAQDHIGIAPPGNSSEESRTWLSQIEDNGAKYRTRNSKWEHWEQKWKIWEERRGEECETTAT